jgi:hypothetical protein
MEAMSFHQGVPSEASNAPEGLPNVVLVAILAVPAVVAAVTLIVG